MLTHLTFNFQVLAPTPAPAPVPAQVLAPVTASDASKSPISLVLRLRYVL